MEPGNVRLGMKALSDGNRNIIARAVASFCTARTRLDRTRRPADVQTRRQTRNRTATAVATGDVRRPRLKPIPAVMRTDLN